MKNLSTINNENDIVTKKYINALVKENTALKNQIPTGTAEGTSITLRDSAGDLSIKNAVIKGRTEQTTLTGKNLFDKNAFSYTLGYYNTSGELKTSTTTGYTNMKIPVSPNTTYTASTIYKLTSANQSDLGAIYFYDTNKSWLSRTALINQVPSYTFTTPQDCYYIDLQISASQSPTFLSKIDEFQIEENSTATDYEQYCGRENFT